MSLSLIFRPNPPHPDRDHPSRSVYSKFVYSSRLARVTLLLSVTLITAYLGGCDDDEDTSSGGEDIAGMTAGGSAAGETAAEAAGAMAGETAGAMAGETAGAMAGETAGVMAGESAGLTGGEDAGESVGDMAGVMAGVMAGDMSGEAAGVQAGVMMSTEYAPETLLTNLDDDGRLAFCEAFVARDEAANADISEADRQAFREKSCLLAGLLGGATNEAGCEEAYQECITSFEAAMVSVDSCLMEFAEAFDQCAVSVAEFETCEVATRDLFLDAILGLPLSQTCADVGDPALFLIASRLPTQPPQECAIPALEMCNQ